MSPSQNLLIVILNSLKNIQIDCNMSSQYGLLINAKETLLERYMLATKARKELDKIIRTTINQFKKAFEFNWLKIMGAHMAISGCINPNCVKYLYR